MSTFVEKLFSPNNDFNHLFEEDSYFFLQEYQNVKKWYIYDSKEIDISVVKALVNQFVSFHAKIPFSSDVTQYFLKDQISSRYWSTVPIGTFAYKMISNGYFYLVDSIKEVPGYLVQGAYWDNGFVYMVKDKTEVLQIKLFIDEETKNIHAYPDIL
jgi:hypothetical protein